jgi:hypothetical protein
MQSRSFHIYSVDSDEAVTVITERLERVEGVHSIQGDASTKIFAIEYDDEETWVEALHILSEMGYVPAHR